MILMAGKYVHWIMQCLYCPDWFEQVGSHKAQGFLPCFRMYSYSWSISLNLIVSLGQWSVTKSSKTKGRHLWAFELPIGWGCLSLVYVFINFTLEKLGGLLKRADGIISDIRLLMPGVNFEGKEEWHQSVYHWGVSTVRSEIICMLVLELIQLVATWHHHHQSFVHIFLFVWGTLYERTPRSSGYVMLNYNWSYWTERCVSQ